MLLSACSMVSLGYRHAPTLLAWRAAEYFELDAEQRMQFRSRLETVHAWHRREQLAPLLATLEETRERLSGPVSRDDGEWLVSALLGHYRAVVARIVAESADLLATLRPEQIAGLERRLAEKAAEYEQIWIDAPPDEVRRARFERIRGHAEDWLGRLEPWQDAWLRARLDAIPVDYRRWREDRSRREAAFVALLAEVSLDGTGPGANSAHGAALRGWALDWDEGRSAEQRMAADRLRHEYIGLGVALINGATPAQRDRIRARLAAYVSALAAHLR